MSPERSELNLLETIQEEIITEVAAIRRDYVIEGDWARSVRVGVLLDVADLVTVAKRITEGEEDD